MQDECIPGRTDPYEFDATGEENGTGVDGLRRPRDDPPKPVSLFTNEGLAPSYKDLDQIFDNSDPDTSSDETVGSSPPPIFTRITHCKKTKNLKITFYFLAELESTASANPTGFQQVRRFTRGDAARRHQAQQQSRSGRSTPGGAVQDVPNPSVARAQSRGVAVSAERPADGSNGIVGAPAYAATLARHLSEHGLAAGGADRGLVVRVQAAANL